MPGYRIRRYNKYRNKRVEVDGIVFDSIKESSYYLFLKSEKELGRIKSFERQPKFTLVKKNDKFRAIIYRADFAVIDNEGNTEIIDIKSPITRKEARYILKKKMLYAFFGIEIKEI